MKKFILLTSSLTLALGASVAISAGAPVSNIFQSGEAAVAADVNTNFQELADRIDAAITTYDYRDYLTAATKKTFSVASNTYCGDTEERTYVRSTNGANTDVTMTLKAKSSGTLCRHAVFKSTNTPTERLLKSKDNYNSGTGTLTASYRLDEPITVRTSSMRQGTAFADASKVFYTNVAGGLAEVLNGVHVQTTYAIGIESITVTAGSYSNCLKTYEKRNSDGFGGNDRTIVSWYCPAVGLAKRIDRRAAGDYYIRELTSITP